jgi:hypothetical protein
MDDYIFVHQRTVFERHLRPALAEAWALRSFTPCLRLKEIVTPLATEYARRYYLAPDSLLSLRLGEGLAFDRSIWRALAGELLVVTAQEIPEFSGSLEPIAAILSPGSSGSRHLDRATSPPIRQALHGSRDLTLGRVAYRPEHAGFNDPSDVARIAAYLESIDPATLSLPDGPFLPGASDGGQEEELLDAREALAFLRDLYCRSRDEDCVVVVEFLH